MKKLILIFAGSLFISVAAAQDREQKENTQPTDRSQQQREQNSQYRVEDMTVVSMEAVPLEMREALAADEKYKGWERSTIYQDSATGDYVVMIKGDNSIEPTAHRFDKDGNPVTDGKDKSSPEE